MRRSHTTQTIVSLILPLYLPSLLFAFARSLLIPVLPLYAKGFDVSYGLIGLLLSADSVGMLIGDMPAGLLVPRMGTKKAMIIGMGIITLSTTALFWAGSLAEAFIYLFISGIGSAIYGVTRHAWISERIQSDERGRAISFMGGVFRMGRFAGPVIGGLIASSYGLRVPFIAFGGAYLLALINIALFMPSIPHRDDANQGTLRLQVSTFGKVFRSNLRKLSSAGAGYLFFQLVRSGPSIIIPLYAADVLNMDVQSIGIILSISSALDMTLFIPVGIMMDRLGRKIAIVSSALFISLGVALIPLTQGFTGLVLVGLIMGFGNGLGAGTMLTLGADLAPSESRGEFLGFWRLVGDTGSTSGPLAVGGVADLLSLSQTAWVIAAFGLLACGIFSFMVSETLEKRKHPIPDGSLSSS